MVHHIRHLHSSMLADRPIRISWVHGDIKAYLCVVTDSAQESPGCGFNGSSHMAEKHTCSFHSPSRILWDQQRSKTGVNIGSAIPLHSQLKDEWGLQSHAEIAAFLLKGEANTVYCVTWRLCWKAMSKYSSWSPCSQEISDLNPILQHEHLWQLNPVACFSSGNVHQERQFLFQNSTWAYKLLLPIKRILVSKDFSVLLWHCLVGNGNVARVGATPPVQEL